MRSKVVAGALAGLLAGLVFGAMMQIMTAPTPDGGRGPVMAMVAGVVRSESLAIGWLYHLFNSAVIGALFGWLLGGRATQYQSGATLGALWGVGWWVLGGLILMPLFLGMAPFAPLSRPPLRSVGIGSLVGHLVYGVILGVAYVRIRRGAQTAASARAPAA